jgi:hypothetical protein
VICDGLVIGDLRLLNYWVNNLIANLNPIANRQSPIVIHQLITNRKTQITDLPPIGF